MQRDGLRPDVVSYALLISAYGKARREEEALAVFEEMLDAGVRCVKLVTGFRTELHNLFITASEKNIRYLFISVYRPTQKAYNILLDAFAISGMVEQARTIFKSMRRDR